MHHNLHDDAIIITDAHFQVGIRETLYDFLLKIRKGQIKTTQLIMMGDMFDLLVGSISHTMQENGHIISLINSLSQDIEVLYFEGNHDFNLKELFPHVILFPIQNQPLICLYHEQTIALSHGDLFQSFWYRVYTTWIRNPFTLKVLNFIDSLGSNFISKNILNKQKNKDICQKIENFSQIIKQKSKKYDIAGNGFDVICEGHYHMHEEYSFEECRYKLFASFACDNIYFRINFKDSIVFTPYKG